MKDNKRLGLWKVRSREVPWVGELPDLLVGLICCWAGHICQRKQKEWGRSVGRWSTRVLVSSVATGPAGSLSLSWGLEHDSKEGKGIGDDIGGALKGPPIPCQTQWVSKHTYDL